MSALIVDAILMVILLILERNPSGESFYWLLCVGVLVWLITNSIVFSTYFPDHAASYEEFYGEVLVMGAVPVALIAKIIDMVLDSEWVAFTLLYNEKREFVGSTIACIIMIGTIAGLALLIWKI